MVGDGKSVVKQLIGALDSWAWPPSADTEWHTSLSNKIAENQKNIAPAIADDRVPMNYYRALKDIREWMPDNAIIVSEGSNTMDIGSTQLPNLGARMRLDAGSFGTMGVGLGFAIAAAVVHPGRPVVALEGDSAFGFSGMEVETACRYGLELKIVILNNGGIGGGMDELPTDQPIPASILTPRARYDKIIEGFGGRGYVVEDPLLLRETLDAALAHKGPTIVNVLIDPKAGRKPQQFQWRT